MSKNRSCIRLRVPMLLALFFVFPGLCTAELAQAASDSKVSSQKSTSTSAGWSSDELNRIIKADDLKISPFREDHTTYGTPTWIWCIEVEGDLYVRAYHGTASSWYKAAIREKAGKIIAAGMTREVTFSAAVGEINEQVDQAYRVKYGVAPTLPT